MRRNVFSPARPASGLVDVATPASLFQSFFMAGFECSAQRGEDGVRLDLLASSKHAELAASDYRLAGDYGIRAARDGLRWFMIESSPGRYDWSSFLPMLRAARDTKMQVVWDLCHYGWPDDIDIWSPEFVDRFARFSGAVARLVRNETDEVPFFCPVNEISFWAWAGAEAGVMNPCAHGEGNRLKAQLVRATIAAIEAIRSEHPGARFLHAEPAIHVDGGEGDEAHCRAAEHYRLAQFEAYDMISGRAAPELGGRPDYLDIVGVNYYPHNQWYLHGNSIPMGHHAYRPFSTILTEIHERYRRPMIIAETGAEGSARAAWLHYIMGEVSIVMERGIAIDSVCLYPILDCPSWTDERVCPVGLFSMPAADGSRAVYPPLAREVQAQQRELVQQRGRRRTGAAKAARRNLSGRRSREAPSAAAPS